jgi:hypothetical protein
MANNLDDIVRVVIDLDAPPADSKSFNHLLILGPPPALKRNPDGTIAEVYTPEVGVYSGTEEVQDAGFAILGEHADPTGAAARIAFSQSPPPDKVHIAVRQRASYDDALYGCAVTEDIEAVIGTETAGDLGFAAGLKFLAVKYPHTTAFCEITKNGEPYSGAVSVGQGEESGPAPSVDYCIIPLDDEGTGTFDIVTPESISAQGKTIQLEYVARWIEGTDGCAIQTVNRSAYESIEDTLARAAEMDGWYMLCPAGIGEEDYDDIAAWIETQEKMAAFARARRRENPLVRLWAFIVEVIFGHAKKYFRSFEITYKEDAAADNRYINVAYAARFLSYQAGSETWVYKTLGAVEPEFPGSTEKKNFEGLSVSFYTKYAGRNVVIGGKVAAGEWIDVIRFRDWLKNDMQIRVLTILFVNPKIPYTDDGIALIKNQMIASLKQGQVYGGVAPTEFDADGNEIPGFKVNVPLAANLTPTQKASRVLKDCTFKARLAGAVHVADLHGALAYSYEGGAE